MQAFINFVATIVLIANLGFSANSYADVNFNHDIIKQGIISKVDIANNSFTVVEKKTGNIKTYNFPEKIKVFVDGKTYHDIARIKPGYFVKLKFKQSNVAVAPALKSRDSNSMTLRGTIINIDKDSMTGTVQQKHTKKIVKFRYADELKQALLKNPRNKLPKRGEKVIFAYRLESLTLSKL